jgi:UDP-N-acetylmuramyl pentapeptide phosphotransferase/UDP-N-acetylglucosamine-1-phosphate transferase
MFILGFYDDLNEVKPEVKLFGQTIAIALLVIFADVRIEFLQHFFNLHTGIWADTILTIIIMLAIINAYNFIDGIDMLAALLGFVIMGILGIWFFAVDQYDYSLALLTLSASLLAFMIYNYSPAKIFMGDTGTMTIGLIMALSLIKFDEINSIISSHYSFVNAPGIAFSFVSLLLFDLLRVSFSRIFKRKSPFHADNTHIHHLFVRMGMNHNIISLVIVSYVITQIALSIILDSYFYSSFNIILINIAYLLLFYSIIFMFLRKNKYKKR